MIRRRLTAVALSSALILGAPAAAFAAEYPAPTGYTGSSTAVPGQTVQISFPANTFAPNSALNGVFGGESATQGSFALAAYEQISATGTSKADGSANVNVTLPANATGTYTITVTDEDGNAAHHTITIENGTATGGTSSTGGSSAGTGSTGGSSAGTGSTGGSATGSTGVAGSTGGGAAAGSTGGTSAGTGSTGGSSAVAGSTSSQSGLAQTGADAASTALWVGGGAAALGVGAIALYASSRRKNA